MNNQMNVLVTGASRGIGKHLVSAYLSRPNHIVIAGVRDPDDSIRAALHSLPRGTSSKLIVVLIDSSSETDAEECVKALTTSHSLTKLDIVIANAGISSYFGKAVSTPAKEMYAHFSINTVGPLLLFQATAGLLEAAPMPKFVAISSGAGSLGGVENLPVENTAYGSSKAALNFVTRRIHYENPWLIAFPINPGWLQTDLGNHAAVGSGLDAAPVAVEDGVRGLLRQIDAATRQHTSGRFMSFDGEQLMW